MTTDPKTDLVLAVIGAVFVYSQSSGTVNAPVIVRAIGAALSLTLVEVIYVAKHVIWLPYPTTNSVH